ncbi:MAG: L-threonylcarbamoyladenylate synthase [Reinekea sp.]|jgi:L-threonylcarbamoyladenylate synthase
MGCYCHHVKVSSDCILSGGIIAYPTEGVYGLGCDPFNADAVGRILRIKGRPISKGLILIADNIERLTPYLQPLTQGQRDKLKQSWPRPTTWVIPHNGILPDWITGGRTTVAVRVTSHPVAAKLCQRTRIPLVSTSANRSNRPALTTSFQVRQHLGKEIDYLLTGQVQTPGHSSTIIDLKSDEYLRA